LRLAEGGGALGLLPAAGLLLPALWRVRLRMPGMGLGRTAGVDLGRLGLVGLGRMYGTGLRLGRLRGARLGRPPRPGLRLGRLGETGLSRLPRARLGLGGLCSAGLSRLPRAGLGLQRLSSGGLGRLPRAGLGLGRLRGAGLGRLPRPGLGLGRLDEAGLRGAWVGRWVCGRWLVLPRARRIGRLPGARPWLRRPGLGAGWLAHHWLWLGAGPLPLAGLALLLETARLGLTRLGLPRWLGGARLRRYPLRPGRLALEWARL
jgi:hypothetical protein